jgi:uncharacterized protein (DUF433 family)
MKRISFDPLEVPNYGFQEAVRYLHVPRTTLNYWLRPSVGLFYPVDPKRLRFSFKNLVECYVLEGLREIHGVHVSAIRKALSYLHEKFESRHPLADYELKTDGRYIFFWHGDEYLNCTLCGQVGLTEILDSYLRRIERDFSCGNWTLYPFMRLDQMRSRVDGPRVVSINPKVCFGLPVLTGSRITTATLASRFLDGDTVALLASQYERPETEIAQAISWETGKEAVAA